MEQPRLWAGLCVFFGGWLSMNVVEVRLQDFRNHRETKLEFGPGLNALTGDNGQGKTNVLEAVSYLSLTKSFYASGDSAVLRHGCARFSVEGALRSDGGVQSTIAVTYDRESCEKAVRINGLRPESLAAVIGRFPVVVLSPENSSVTFGGPADRRRFIDLVLSQLSRSYFQDLVEYRRVLRQRNRLLVESAGRRLPADLESWDSALAQAGGRIIHRRRAFVNEFAAFITKAYENLTDGAEEPAMEYHPVPAVEADADPGEIQQAIEEGLRRTRAEDSRRCSTQTGPHRDELRFLVNGRSVRLYASQGQHKTLLVALKVAEFRFLRERLGERPVFLLDDVFSELDRGRAHRLLGLVTGLGQTVITSTDTRVFEESVVWDTDNRLFRVDHGTVCAA